MESVVYHISISITIITTYSRRFNVFIVQHSPSFMFQMLPSTLMVLSSFCIFFDYMNTDSLLHQNYFLKMGSTTNYFRFMPVVLSSNFVSMNPF